MRRRPPYAREPFRGRGTLRGRLLAALAIMGVGGATGAIAPIVDDLRSGLRTMTATCRVERVIDGDTVDLACRGRRGIRARVEGYDAPELFSPSCRAERSAAERARHALVDAVAAARNTEVAFLGADRYGRDLVDMRLDGRRVAAFMVETGHGRRYLGGLRGGWCG